MNRSTNAAFSTTTAHSDHSSSPRTSLMEAPRTPLGTRASKDALVGSSPTSAVGLYPIVHDLSEYEYDVDCCCDPVSLLMENFLLPSSEESIEVMTLDSHGDDRQRSSAYLLTQSGMTNESKDSFRELPQLVRRKRSTTIGGAGNSIVASTSWASMPPSTPDLAHKSSHRRSISEGTGAYMASMHELVGGGKKRFVDSYVLTRQVSQRAGFFTCFSSLYLTLL